MKSIMQSGLHSLLKKFRAKSNFMAVSAAYVEIKIQQIEERLALLNNAEFENQSEEEMNGNESNSEKSEKSQLSHIKTEHNSSQLSTNRREVR